MQPVPRALSCAEPRSGPVRGWRDTSRRNLTRNRSAEGVWHGATLATATPRRTAPGSVEQFLSSLPCFAEADTLHVLALVRVVVGANLILSFSGRLGLEAWAARTATTALLRAGPGLASRGGWRGRGRRLRSGYSLGPA